MKKPLKVFSSTALAALFAASAIVPVQAAAADEVVVTTPSGIVFGTTVVSYTDFNEAILDAEFGDENPVLDVMNDENGNTLVPEAIKVGDDYFNLSDYSEIMLDAKVNGETIELEEALQSLVTEYTPLSEEETSNFVNYEEDTEVTVESVSAINKTINFNVAALEPAEDATANVAIFALDDEGEKTGTAIISANNVVIEENVVTFDVSSKTFGDDEYVVEVTIGETTEAVNVTVEFDAVEKLVADINAATAAQLATLLADEAYFTGFDVANVDAYATNAGTQKTIAEVQKEVIDAAASISEFNNFKTEIEDAEKADYAKYLVLKGQFSNVLDANMNGYMNTTGLIFITDTDTLDGAMTDFDAVSDAIDVVNLDAVVASDSVTVDADAKPSDLDAYKVALEALVLVNDEVTDTANTKTKAALIEEIDTQLEAIATVQETADAAVVKAEAAMAEFVTATGESFDETTPVYKNVVDEIAKLDAEDLTENEINAVATALGNGEDDSQLIHLLVQATEEITIIEDTLAALAEFEAAFEVNNATAGNLETVYTDVTANFTDYDNEDYSYDTASAKDIDTLKIALTALETETAEWETYNDAIAATTATEMSSLLFDLDSGDAFLNLSSATKAEFAGYVLEALAEEDPAPADFDTLQTAVFTTGYLSDYQALISSVNDATDIAGMITALTALENDAFDALTTTAEQADVADTVLTEANVADFKTIADIEAAMGL